MMSVFNKLCHNTSVRNYRQTYSNYLWFSSVKPSKTKCAVPRKTKRNIFMLV